MKKMRLLSILVLLFLCSCGESVEEKLPGKWNVTNVRLTEPEKNPALADQVSKLPITGAHKYTFYDFMPDGRYDLSIAGDTVGGRWALEAGRYLLLKNKFGALKWELKKIDQEEIIMVQQSAGGMEYTMKKINGWQE